VTWFRLAFWLSPPIGFTKNWRKQNSLFEA
jgi:hypothetical protein